MQTVQLLINCQIWLSKQQQEYWSSSHQHSSFLYCDFSLPGMQGVSDPIWTVKY